MEPVVGPGVEMRDFGVWFGDRAILRELNLALRPGELTVIIGHSGSGKTTLLRAINRLNALFPDYRTAGLLRLRLDGKLIDVNDGALDATELRRRAAMVFQTPNVLPVSIRRNITLPQRLALGVDKARATQRREQALRDVQLFEEVKDRLHENALKLSGGQQQRLCLARALALEPDILLLDDPTASLDFQATRGIERLLADLKTRYTILAVSHSLAQTSRLADRCLILREGRIVEEVDRSQLHQAERFQKLVEDVF
jgi:phosphate transport system ATP-binding protein